MELAPKPVIPKGPPLKREREPAKYKPEGHKAKKGKKETVKGKGLILGKVRKIKSGIWYKVSTNSYPFTSLVFMKMGGAKSPTQILTGQKSKTRLKQL